MRILAITKVFPNAVAPLSEPHIRQQYAALGRRCELEVLATIPWFPAAPLLKKWSPAGRVCKAPFKECIDGLEVYHPRYLLVPVVGLPIQAFLYAGSLLPLALRYRHKIDAILATWAYPDGAAAILLGHLLRVPVVVEVIGSDINVVAQMASARIMLKQFLPRAARIVAVSRQLARSVAELGVPRQRIDVHPTGVDRALFYPRQQAEARHRIGWDHPGKMILFVGRLERQKGIFELVDAFVQLAVSDPETSLVFVGDGSAKKMLQERVASCGRYAAVMGQRPLSEIPNWLGACDLLALPSWAEGTPNVILEALASGRPVVASQVGGIPDLITAEKYGLLVEPKDSVALGKALAQVIRSPYDAQEISRAPVVLDLEENARRVQGSLEQAVRDYRR